MAKNSVRDYSATASLNTDVQSVDIDEGCAPSGINNAIREVMADLKNVSTGAIALESPAADSLSVTGNITVSGTVDGRDVAADGTKLDGIESGATADQTKADIDALGIDAETIDGLNSTQFLRSDADDSFSGKLTGGTMHINGQIIASSAQLQVNGFMRTGTIYLHEGSTPTSNNYSIATTSGGELQWNGSKVWTAGNDGSGSGLDADTLDGVQGSSYLRSDANDTYAGVLTLDGRLTIQNDVVSGQGDNNTHFNYNATGVNYITGTTTYIRGTTLSCNARIEMTNVLDMNNYDINGVAKIVHHGDTDTYTQFHTADQWRVVTGGSERIEVSGSALQCQVEIRSTANIIAYYSDERLKTKVGNIDSPLDKVMSLEGFYYVENDLAKSYGFDSDKQQVALSAQSVEAVMPEAVHPAPFDTDIDEDGNDFSKSGENYLTVDYARLVPLLVEAIKELKSEIEELKNGSAN